MPPTSIPTYLIDYPEARRCFAELERDLGLKLAGTFEPVGHVPDSMSMPKRSATAPSGSACVSDSFSFAITACRSVFTRAGVDASW